MKRHSALQVLHGRGRLHSTASWDSVDPSRRLGEDLVGAGRWEEATDLTVIRGFSGGAKSAIEEQVLKVKLKCIWNQTWKFKPLSKSRQKCQALFCDFSIDVHDIFTIERGVETLVAWQKWKPSKVRGLGNCMQLLQSHRIHVWYRYLPLFTYIWLMFIVNVGKYIRGSYGNERLYLQYWNCKQLFCLLLPILL